MQDFHLNTIYFHEKRILPYQTYIPNDFLVILLSNDPVSCPDTIPDNLDPDPQIPRCIELFKIKT